MKYKCDCGAKKNKGIIVHTRGCAVVRKGKDDWTKNEIFAVDNFTCEYPDDQSFEQIMELIEDGSDLVTIWEPFEYHDGNHICELIQNMVDGLDRTYKIGAK